MKIIDTILQSVGKIDDITKIVQAILNAFEKFTETLKNYKTTGNEK